jgi:hypothetical protein
MTIVRVMLALVAVCVPSDAICQDKIKVYVGSPGDKDGFVAAGAGDSMADLTKSLNRKKRLTVVATRNEADLEVLVDSRDSHWENGRVTSWTDSKGKTHVYQPVSNTRVVHAVLKVGDYKLPLHGESVTWSGASDEVADDVAKWVDTNLVTLITRRTERK